MAKFRIKPESIGKLQLNLAKWGEEKKKKLGFALDNWGEDTVAMFRDEIQKVGALDQGQLLAANGRTPVERDGTKLRVKAYNNSEHAPSVEWGREPGKKPPPTLPLVGWAHRRGMIRSLPVNISFGGEWAKKWSAAFAIMNRKKDGATGGGVGKTKPKKEMDPDIKDMLVVLGIRRAIQINGIKGRFPFRTVYERRRATFLQDITKFVG